MGFSVVANRDKKASGVINNLVTNCGQDNCQMCASEFKQIINSALRAVSLSLSFN